MLKCSHILIFLMIAMHGPDVLAQAKVQCDCIDSLYAKSDTDYRSSFGDLEDGLIEQGVLDTDGAEGYYALLDWAEIENRLFFIDQDYDPLLVDVIATCVKHKKCDGPMSAKFFSLHNSMQLKENLSPAIISQLLHESLSESDLENVWAKHLAVMFFVRVPQSISDALDAEQGIKRRLPPIGEKNHSVKRRIGM